MASFDQLAKAYEPLERLTFAGRLQEIRRFCLPHIRSCQRGLLIGDGDGRFSNALLAINSNIHLDSIDISPRMLEVAQERAAKDSDRLTPHATDALRFQYPDSRYDFIGLHFCLDCFSQDAVDSLLPQLERSLKPGGIIAYSDFQATKLWQRVLIQILYFSFRLGAGLKTSRLPIVKWSPNLETIASKEILGGLVFSQVLQKRYHNI